MRHVFFPFPDQDVSTPDFAVSPPPVPNMPLMPSDTMVPTAVFSWLYGEFCVAIHSVVAAMTR
jgi:hypothetical protein